MGNVKPCIRFGNCHYYQCAPVGAPELTAITQECRTTGCDDENRDCSCMKLSARGTIDVCEVFINASFVLARKGNARLENRNAVCAVVELGGSAIRYEV
jgi:hypothetical protein